MRSVFAFAACVGVLLASGVHRIDGGEPKDPVKGEAKARLKPQAKAAVDGSAKDAKTAPPDSTTPPPPAAAPASTHKIKREVFKVELTLKGTFEAQKMAEVVLRPEVWSNLEVVKVVEHGQTVKAGDVLLQCDTTKIDEEIAELKTKTTVAEIALKLAEENLRTAEATAPLDLKQVERRRQQTEEDLARFLRLDRALSEKTAEHYLKSAERILEYEREELRQLEKMYKADELTEETEEIVLRRQRNAVEAAEFMVERARAARDETIQVDLPRRQEALEQENQRQGLLAAKSKATIPLALEQQRRELAKLKMDRAKDEDRLKKLLADREMLTVRSPLAGVVYHGQFTRGRWSGSESLATSLRRGGSPSKNTVLMTVVGLRPMFVRATVSESDLGKLREGLAASVRPVAFADLKLPGSIARLDKLPAAPDAFDARIDVKLDSGDPRVQSLVPGMSCTVKVVPYSDRRALTAPAKAVFEDELDEDVHFVFVVGKDGKPQKRPVVVGRRAEDKVEIVRGLNENEEILLERPREQEAAASEKSKSEPAKR